MKPLNIEERRKAFFHYLVMYIVTTSLAVYAICFVCGVPEKQNQLLLEKNQKLNAIIEAPNTYLKKLNDLNQLVLVSDSLTDNTLADNLDKMRQLKNDLDNAFKNDSAILGNPLALSYLNTVNALHASLTSKSKLISEKRDVEKFQRKAEKLLIYSEKLKKQISDLGYTVIPSEPILED